MVHGAALEKRFPSISGRGFESHPLRLQLLNRESRMITHKGVAIPEDFAKSLREDTKVMSIFEAMRPSCQNSYVMWIEEAKKPETRERRIKKANEMILDYGRRHPNRRLPLQA